MRKCKTCKKREARKHQTECRTCEGRKYRAKNPMRTAYNNLKQNAKRRGIIFTISFEYFSKFAVETEYLTGKGKTAESYSVDRKDPNLGYTEGNLQILTLANNTKKMHMDYDWQNQTVTLTPVGLSDNNMWFDE